MKATIYGNIDKPVMAIVGVWDPFLPAHQELFARLISEAAARDHASVAILLDPAPQMLMYGPSAWPVYDNLHSRIRQMMGLGLDGLLHLDFAREDLKAGASDFFETVTAQVNLAELWLGQHQRLGSGDLGSVETVNRVAELFEVRLERLPEADLGALSRDIRTLLGAGSLREAQNVVGRPPVMARPEALELECAWKPGLYQAKALTGRGMAGETLYLELVQDQERRRFFKWPDQGIEFLAFIAGPGDEGQANQAQAA